MGKFGFDKKQLNVLCYWILEREKIRTAKDAGDPKPWTKDPIIRDHRWCNVRRMDDKVSKWLMDNWYNRKAQPGTILASATMARMINWPDSLECIGGGKRFDQYVGSREIRRVLKYRKAQGEKVFTGAYIINGAMGGDKIDQVMNTVDYVFERSEYILSKTHMQETHHRLMDAPGVGSFIAGQIVADLRHLPPMVKHVRDQMVWAPIGPGSRRGMRRLLGKDYNGPMKQSEFNLHLQDLVGLLQNDELTKYVFIERKLEAMDIQNCLCEYDKFCRLTNKEGSVRSGYPGLPETGKLF